MTGAFPTAQSQWYFDALRAGRLDLQRCGACDAWARPADAACPQCRSTDLSPAPSGGRGRVVSAIRDHRAGVVVGLVELEEGPWIAAGILGTDDAVPVTDLIGTPVAFEVVQFDEGEPVPAFRFV